MELKLSTGRVLNIALTTVTHLEFVSYWDEKTSAEEKTAIFKRIVGVTEAEADEMPEADWRLIRDAFQEVCFPKDPKNSPSAST